MSIQQRCRDARKAAGLSIRQLSAESGLSRKTISKMESMSEDPGTIPFGHYQQFARAVGEPCDWLLFGNLTNEKTVEDLRRVQYEFGLYLESIIQGRTKN